MKSKLWLVVPGVLALVALVLLATLPAAAFTPQFTANLWACGNGDGTKKCTQIAGGNDFGWNPTGNLGNISKYNYDNVVPFRITFTGLSAGDVVTVTYRYGFVDSGFAFDRMDTWYKTVGFTGASPTTTTDPCVGTTLNCQNPSTFTMDRDPQILNNSLCPSNDRTNYLGAYSSDPGTMYGYNATIQSVKYADNHTNTPQCSSTQNTDAVVTVNFIAPAPGDAVLVFGLHVAKPAIWVDVASATQSSYHANLDAVLISSAGSAPVNPGGWSNNQLQMKLHPVNVTAVTLSRFIGLESAPDSVTLAWTTASEVNTAGFNLYRSESANGPYTRINPQLIPTAANALTGGKYEYQDASAVPGQQYYYQLEDVELNGTSVRHAPIQVVAPQAASSSSPVVFAGLGIGVLAVVVGSFVLARKKFSR